MHQISKKGWRLKSTLRILRCRIGTALTSVLGQKLKEPWASSHSSSSAVISIILEIWLTFRAPSGSIPRMKNEDAAARLEALGNPTRLQIYRALVRAGKAGMAV